MPAIINSSEIARETIRLLVIRKIEPTPENYRKVYNETAGIHDEPPGSWAERTLAKMAALFPRSRPELVRIANGLNSACTARNWDRYLAAFATIGQVLGESESASSALDWPAAIRALIHACETSHAGITRAAKREAVEHVLTASAGNPEKLHQRLTALARSWADMPAAAALETGDPVAEPNEPRPGSTPNALNELHKAAREEQTATVYRDLLVRLLAGPMTQLLASKPELMAEADALAAKARNACEPAAISELAQAIRDFCFQIEVSGEHADDLQEGLLRLLKLLIENIRAISSDDQWMRGQLDVVLGIVSSKLDRDLIASAERSLKKVIFNQSTRKQSLTDAKNQLRTLVSTFMDSLGTITESTGDYQRKMGDLAARIESADELTELAGLVDEAVRETRIVQESALRSHEGLQEARRKAESAEERIKVLESELETMSGKVREDQLTGALNRRGLDEAFARAAAESERREEPLCVALLDIDNFKSLNDTYGHQAGDDALVRLSDVIRKTVRPSDSVARYGGEEFLVLIKGCGLDESIEIMKRVQRSLTKEIFLRDNQRLLITFSAGVALRQSGETQQAVIARADGAMYEAKRTGKNRVLPAT